MTQEQEPQAEFVINKSSSKEGGIGWSVRLLRHAEETDAEYMARTLLRYWELESGLMDKRCCHDDCAQQNKDANRA